MQAQLQPSLKNNFFFLFSFFLLLLLVLPIFLSFTYSGFELHFCITQRCENVKASLYCSSFTPRFMCRFRFIWLRYCCLLLFYIWENIRFHREDYFRNDLPLPVTKFWHYNGLETNGYLIFTCFAVKLYFLIVCFIQGGGLAAFKRKYFQSDS